MAADHGDIPRNGLESGPFQAQGSEALAAFREDEEEERDTPGMPRGSPAARGPGPPATSAGSPGMDVLARRNAALPRGAGSGAGSSGSSGAVTPVSLRRQIEQEYDPSQESREDWQRRVLRGVAQLERLGAGPHRRRDGEVGSQGSVRRRPARREP